MLTGKTTLPHSAGTPARLTLICSSSPSPPPVRLSPMCSTDPSGLCRLLKNTKWPSDRTRPFMSSMIADASRSKSAPVVVRGSQPSPTTTAESPGACFESDTLPPLLRLTLTFCSLVRMRLYEYAKSLPVAGDLTHQRQYTVLPAPMKEDESWARVVLSNMLRLLSKAFFSLLSVAVRLIRLYSHVRHGTAVAVTRSPWRMLRAGSATFDIDNPAAGVALRAASGVLMGDLRHRCSGRGSMRP